MILDRQPFNYVTEENAATLRKRKLVLDVCLCVVGAIFLLALCWQAGIAFLADQYEQPEVLHAAQ